MLGVKVTVSCLTREVLSFPSSSSSKNIFRHQRRHIRGFRIVKAFRVQERYVRADVDLRRSIRSVSAQP